MRLGGAGLQLTGVRLRGDGEGGLRLYSLDDCIEVYSFMDEMVFLT